LEYCVRAGAAALGAFSYEEAIEHYGQALVAIEAAASGDELLRCEVLIALGEAEWRGGHVEDARETFARAARIARSGADAGALGRAALGFCGVGWERFGAPDPEASQLLESALQAEPDDPALRAKLTARLAEVVHSNGQTEEAEALGERAIEIARGADDLSALAAALIGRWYAILRPDTLDERVHLVNELLTLREELRDRDLQLQVQTLRARVAAETGDMDALGSAISDHARLADQSKQPGNQLHSHAYRAARAQVRGRFDEVEELAAQVIELGMLAQSPGAVYYSAVELIMLRWEQGRLEELDEPLQQLNERTGAPIWRAARALLCSERGDLAQAAEELAVLSADRCAAVPFNGNWLGALTFLSFTCLNLNDSERAAELYELLEPYRGRFVVIGAVAACLGPVSHLLGALALVSGEWDRAVDLQEEATAASRAAGSEPWLTRAQFRLALALRGRGEPEDLRRANEVIAEARAKAEQLGMGRIVSLIAAAEQQSTETSSH
jgi:tetratricopeptide (TPR) repeat protein